MYEPGVAEKFSIRTRGMSTSSPARGPGDSIPSRKVLLIDDERDVQRLVKMSLEFTAGHEVILAEDGEAGIEMAENEHPDTILLDIVMPKLDGFGVLDILKGNDKTKDIPVIFLTAKARRCEVEQGLRMGAADYIVKPFDAMKLSEEIERVLSTQSI